MNIVRERGISSSFSALVLFLGLCTCAVGAAHCGVIDKVMDVDLCAGTRMPKTALLGSGTIATVSNWICAGAPNNGGRQAGVPNNGARPAGARALPAPWAGPVLAGGVWAERASAGGVRPPRVDVPATMWRTQKKVSRGRGLLRQRLFDLIFARVTRADQNHWTLKLLL